MQSDSIHQIAFAILLLILLMACWGCRNQADPSGQPQEVHGAAPTNRVELNSAVRQNLGVTFAQVQKRHVARTLRIPGRFELTPNARRTYRSQLPATIELLVEPFQQVQAGTPLFRLDSPAWRDLQEKINESTIQLESAKAELASYQPMLAANEGLAQSHQKALSLWQDRVATLERLQADGGVVTASTLIEAKASLVASQTSAAESRIKQAELEAARSQAELRWQESQTHLAILLQTASALTGQDPETLIASDGERPNWQSIRVLEVVALAPGVVEKIEVNSGAFVEANALVMSVVQPEHVFFVASALQADASLLQSGAAATVVAPQGGSLQNATAVQGTLIVGPTASADRRTIELIVKPTQSDVVPLPTWARAGISAYLEIVVEGSSAADLAIPLACVAKDGTRSYIFRRDPNNANAAIRIEADLGIDDGRWVVVKSGVLEGDEIVLEGAYQLMVASSGSISLGGHFHADGSFHSDDH